MLKKKKGQSGNAVQYLTRNQTLKKLQLKLSEFRRLCILKGIHPREPRKKTQGAHKTYYHVKDIAFLLHEPLLKKVRELAAYDKKVRRASAKKNKDLAARLAARRPGYRLDHLVRERYPSFVDALRDLDDPITMVHLFAVLPAEAAHGIPPERVHLSRRLALEWQAWVVRAHALRKAFISVKGFYYQAEVAGQAITWLVPHQTSQVLPPDVDFKVMLTFLELHQTTLQFVLHKLYHMEGLRYPPVMDSKLEEAAAGLQAVMADLAAGGPVAGAGALLEDGAGAGKKKRRRGAKKGGAAGAVNPEATARLGSLAAKVAELEEEIKEMGDKAQSKVTAQQKKQKQQQVAASESESEDEDVELEIDSGDEEEEEEGSEEEEDDAEGSDSEEESAGDPSDEDIPTAIINDGDADAAQLVGGAGDVDADSEDALCASLFRGMVFFLGREVPREQLLLVIRSFGGEVGWGGEGSPVAEDDERITHQVVDRPSLAVQLPNRQYVQPQWVFDSANARVLVRAPLYEPGKVPPPHLSPFVDAEAEGYMPEYGKEIKALQEAAAAARQQAASAAAEGEFVTGDGAAGDEEGGAAGEAGVGATEAEAAAAAEQRYAEELARELGKDKEEAAAGGRKRRRKEEAVPAGGEEGEEEDGMAAIMMTRKVRRAYDKSMKEQAAKAGRVEELKTRASKLKQKRGGAA